MILGYLRPNLKRKFLSSDHPFTDFRQNYARALIGVASFAVLALLLPLPVGASSLEPIRELLWAGDPEGGAPFVEADPAQPAKLVGFDVEIADLIARGLGRKAVFTTLRLLPSINPSSVGTPKSA
jgi:ABC-type amino acid transport substrate-binding protein